MFLPYVKNNNLVLPSQWEILKAWNVYDNVWDERDLTKQGLRKCKPFQRETKLVFMAWAASSHAEHFFRVGTLQGHIPTDFFCYRMRSCCLQSFYRKTFNQIDQWICLLNTVIQTIQQISFERKTHAMKYLFRWPTSNDKILVFWSNILWKWT